MSGLLYQRGAFAHLPDKVQMLRHHGIELVVSLWHPDPDLTGIVEYIHCPIADGKVVDPCLMELIPRVTDALRAARPTLVHCHAGRNRSALVNALVIREFTGCSGAEAAARVRRCRPGALENPAFYDYMCGLD